MEKYDPMIAPDPKEWMELDEQERINLVMNYHIACGEMMENVHAHSIFHTVVENQIAMGDEYPTKATLERLMREGLDRHDSIHAIASVLANHVWKIGKKKMKGDVNKIYMNALEKLTAQKWIDEEI